MEGIEKPKSFFEKARSRFSYWLAEREASNLKKDYEKKIVALADLFVKAFNARGLYDASPKTVIIPMDDPLCVAAIARVEDAIRELRIFEREKLGMTEDSPELKSAIEDLEVVRDLENEI